MGHFLYISPFQSTLPVWGGTRAVCETFRAIHDFTPPSPCGEGPGKLAAGGVNGGISIHPPRVGRDSGMLSLMYTSLPFQSTLPVWGGTWAGSGAMPQYSHFNPPSPCGEGLYTILLAGKLYYFNPPSPCGEGRCVPMRFQNHICISIHPPRVGRDHSDHPQLR